MAVQFERRAAKGLRGNLVSLRCKTLADRSDRELVFFLQEVSMRDGFRLHRTCANFPAWPWPSSIEHSERALRRVAREMMELFPANFAECDLALNQVEEALERFCLDPSFHLSSIPAGASILEALRQYKDRFEASLGREVARDGDLKDRV